MAIVDGFRAKLRHTVWILQARELRWLRHCQSTEVQVPSLFASFMHCTGWAVASEDTDLQQRRFATTHIMSKERELWTQP